MVCSTCAKRLEGVHRFATMAYRTQERLRLQFNDVRTSDDPEEIGHEKNAGSDEKEKIKRFSEDREKLMQKDRGLLHSILTKVLFFTIFFRSTVETDPYDLRRGGGGGGG